MSDLKITTVQTSLDWENPQQNRDGFDKLLEDITEPTDLILLPEMFSTGFTMNTAQVAEEMNGETIAWMKQKAVEKNCVISGSLIIKEDGNYYNRLIWMRPDGTYEYYDKRHLFRMAEEDQYFNNGNKRLIVELKGWRICPLVCYDLRFPVWSRNAPLKNENTATEMGNEPVYDCLIYVANWPKPRFNAWASLLLARAIENQCYVIGLNRIGQDGKGISYLGGTVVVDPYGKYVNETPLRVERADTSTLSKSLLESFREKFPVAMDADHFNIEVKG